jgi:dihydroorotate dehydrogenase (fumarate)
LSQCAGRRHPGHRPDASRPQLELDRLLETTSEHYGEALSCFPDLQDYNTGPWTYLDHIEQAKRALSVPVIASLNGITPGGWVGHAKRMRDAGADALELNLYTVATDPGVGAAELEARYLDLVADVRSAVAIPVAVKLSPFFTALANFAARLEEAGVDGLVLFNRFYQPDLDLDSRDVVPRLVLSTSEELRLPLRWIALLYGRGAHARPGRLRAGQLHPHPHVLVEPGPGQPRPGG